MKALPIISLNELEDRAPVWPAWLARYFEAAVKLMTVVARAAGHGHLSGFNANDLTSFKTDMCQLTGVAYGGVGPIK